MEKMKTETDSESISEIQSFFKDSSVFITGATGFLGHVLLAKLLKCCPDIKKIYILLRSKKGKTVQQRFSDMLEDEVFGVLKKEYSEQLQKVHAIAGDCLQIKLGISDENMELLKSEVNVVFHIAATVKFDAPLKYAVHMNIRSTSELLELAREMKQLKSFVHVSTAFSNCVDRKTVEEKLYKPPIPAEKLMNLVDNLDEEILNRITPSLLGNYPNTYIFTKAVAENLCKTKGAHLPLAVFRPAIVISSVEDPIPGWINNVYGPTGVVAAAAVGLLHVIQVDQSCKANIVPCDYVVNAAIASAWSIGTRSSNQQSVLTQSVSKNSNNNHEKLTHQKNDVRDNSVTPCDRISGQILNGKVPNMNGNCNSKLANDAEADEEYDSKEIQVFNYSCDILRRPLTWKEFMKLNEDQEPLMPSAQSIWTYSLTLIKYRRLYQFLSFLLHIIPAFFADSASRLLGREPKLLDAYQKLHKLAEVLSYFSTQEWKITNDNVWSVWNKLPDKDKKMFDFDMNNVDWYHYYHQHCVGIRKFILKESPETIPFAKKKRILLLILHYSLMLVVSISSLFLLVKMSKFILY